MVSSRTIMVLVGARRSAPGRLTDLLRRTAATTPVARRTRHWPVGTRRARVQRVQHGDRHVPVGFLHAVTMTC
jgi:hypothetical protein